MAGREDETQQLVADVVVDAPRQFQPRPLLLLSSSSRPMSSSCVRALASRRGRSHDVWRWPSARRRDYPGRPPSATAPARRPARPARLPRPGRYREYPRRAGDEPADSILQTASMARWVSASRPAVTIYDRLQATFPRGVTAQRPTGFLQPLRLPSRQPGDGLLDLGWEVGELLHLAHLNDLVADAGSGRPTRWPPPSTSPGSSSSRRALPSPLRKDRRSPSASAGE